MITHLLPLEVCSLVSDMARDGGENNGVTTRQKKKSFKADISKYMI